MKGAEVKEDTVPAVEEPQPKRDVCGQITARQSKHVLRVLGKIPGLQEHRGADAIRGGFRAKGSVQDGSRKMGKICPLELREGGARLWKGFQVRMSIRRGWRGRPEPGPEVPGCFDGQEGAMDGS